MDSTWKVIKAKSIFFKTAKKKNNNLITEKIEKILQKACILLSFANTFRNFKLTLSVSYDT